MLQTEYRYTIRDIIGLSVYVPYRASSNAPGISRTPASRAFITRQFPRPGFECRHIWALLSANREEPPQISGVRLSCSNFIPPDITSIMQNRNLRDTRAPRCSHIESRRQKRETSDLSPCNTRRNKARGKKEPAREYGTYFCKCAVAQTEFVYSSHRKRNYIYFCSCRFVQSRSRTKWPVMQHRG